MLSKITFDLERNPEMGLYVIYAGLRMYMETKQRYDLGKEKSFSFAGAEAYCLLQDLKEKHPKLYAECEEEFNYSKEDSAKSLAELEFERFAWSLETFPEATAISSLRKAESEIKEIEENILSGKKDPEEYVDALKCIFDAAGRDGVSFSEIVEAYEAKLRKNKSRKWVKNPDNSYSHIKATGS